MLEIIDHISFHPLHREDFPQVNEWLHRPHVAQWWYPDVLPWDEFVAKYEKLLASDSCYGYIVWVDETPIGYIAEYDASREPDLNGNLDPKGTYGFDVYIGETEYLGKGYGTAICQKFVKHLINDRGATRLIIDPRADNSAAIKTYQKAGFKPVKEVLQPGYGTVLNMAFDVPGEQ